MTWRIAGQPQQAHAGILSKDAQHFFRITLEPRREEAIVTPGRAPPHFGGLEYRDSGASLSQVERRRESHEPGPDDPNVHARIG